MEVKVEKNYGIEVGFHSYHAPIFQNYFYITIIIIILMSK